MWACSQRFGLLPQLPVVALSTLSAKLQYLALTNEITPCRVTLPPSSLSEMLCHGRSGPVAVCVGLIALDQAPV